MPSKYDCLQISPYLLLLLHSLYTSLENRLVPSATESAAYYTSTCTCTCLQGGRVINRLQRWESVCMRCVCVCVCIGRANERVCNTHTHIHAYTRVQLFVVCCATGQAAWPGAFWRHQLPYCCAPLIHKRRKILCTARAGQQQKQPQFGFLFFFFFLLQQTCESTKCKQYMHTLALLCCMQMGENASGENENENNNK